MKKTFFVLTTLMFLVAMTGTAFAYSVSGVPDGPFYIGEETGIAFSMSADAGDAALANALLDVVITPKDVDNFPALTGDPFFHPTWENLTANPGSLVNPSSDTGAWNFFPLVPLNPGDTVVRNQGWTFAGPGTYTVYVSLRQAFTVYAQSSFEVVITERPVVSTTASSPWSVALIAIAAIGVAAWFGRRRMTATEES